MGTVVPALVTGQLECGPSGEQIVCGTTDTKLSLEVPLLPTDTLFLILTPGGSPGCFCAGEFQGLYTQEAEAAK